MRELPDICAYLTALEARIRGQRLERVRIASPFLLRTADPPMGNVEGNNVKELRRIGKRIALGLDNDLWFVIHLMIAGRLHWRPPGGRLSGRVNLAAFDFPSGSLLLTEAASKKRASLHVIRGEEGLRAIDPGGLEVFESDLDSFRAALSAENRTLKRALTDPRMICGIGNAYSDEIATANRAHAAARKSCESDMPTTRPITARVVRPVEKYSPIAHSRDFWGPIGLARWRNSRR